MACETLRAHHDWQPPPHDWQPPPLPSRPRGENERHAGAWAAVRESGRQKREEVEEKPPPPPPGAPPNRRKKDPQPSPWEEMGDGAGYCAVVPHEASSSSSQKAVNGAQHRGREPGRALRLAAEKLGKVEEVQELLDNGADVSDADRGGKTALHCAARAGNYEVCVLLLEARADANARDRNSGTPLDEAHYWYAKGITDPRYEPYAQGCWAAQQVLLEAGAVRSTPEEHDPTDAYFYDKRYKKLETQMATRGMEAPWIRTPLLALDDQPEHLALKDSEETPAQSEAGAPRPVMSAEPFVVEPVILQRHPGDPAVAAHFTAAQRGNVALALSRDEVLRAGGLFRVIQDYSELPVSSGYLQLVAGEMVEVQANTVTPGDLGNTFGTYVFGERREGGMMVKGWFPTDILDGNGGAKVVGRILDV